MRVVWREAAYEDVLRILAHIEDENPLAARRVAREFLLAGDSLSSFPNRGRMGLTEGTRELVPIRPYVLVYKVDKDVVTIISVWHGAQDRS